MFVLVLIHELGHVTAATSYHWRIQSIELLPFGGVARTDEWGTVPAREEIVVALAGPFHNIIMILFGYFFFKMGWWSAEWTNYFVQGNAFLAGFNLLPIYPLDGGRVLQALLCYLMPFRQAVRISIGIGMIGAGVLLWISVLGSELHLNLAAVALFLLYSNGISLKHRKYQYMRFLIHRKENHVPDGARIIRLTVRPEEPLSVVLKRLRKEAYHVLEVQEPGGKRRMVPEEVLFQSYFGEKRTRGIIADLIA